MAKLINLKKAPITLQTGHVVAPGGTLTTTNDVLRAPDNLGQISGLTLSGDARAEYDADPGPPPVSDPGPLPDLAASHPPEISEPAKGKPKG